MEYQKSQQCISRFEWINESAKNSGPATFQIFNRIVTQKNKLEVEEGPEELQEFEIKNHFVNVSSSQITKITQIFIGSRVIRVTDVFTSNPLSHIATKSQEYQKSQISFHSSRNYDSDRQFKSKLYRQGLEKLKFRNSKNVIRNTYRLFQKWVSNKYSNLPELSNHLSYILSTLCRYNKQLICQIFKNAELRRIFREFSEEQEGQRMIRQSRIFYKQNHIKALKKYAKICHYWQQSIRQLQPADLHEEQIRVLEAQRQDQSNIKGEKILGDYEGVLN